MPNLLTKQQLENHLYDFRNILGHFDYSSLKNVTFLNADAFYAYMTNVKGNPFSAQYDALQKKLDVLQPYLPFVSGERATQFLEALNQTHSDEEIDSVKKSYTKKLREDFINYSRTVTTDTEWLRVIDTCEEIRMRKEEMLLAHH